MIYGCIIPGAQVDIYWNDVKHWFQKSIEKSKANDTVEELYNYTKNNYPEFCLLLFTEMGKIKGAAIMQSDNGALNCAAIGGEGLLEQSDRLLMIWKVVAKEMECSRLKFTGRAGWLRVFKDKFTKNGDSYGWSFRK